MSEPTQAHKDEMERVRQALQAAGVGVPQGQDNKTRAEIDALYQQHYASPDYKPPREWGVPQAAIGVPVAAVNGALAILTGNRTSLGRLIGTNPDPDAAWLGANTIDGWGHQFNEALDDAIPTGPRKLINAGLEAIMNAQPAIGTMRNPRGAVAIQRGIMQDNAKERAAAAVRTQMRNELADWSTTPASRMSVEELLADTSQGPWAPRRQVQPPPRSVPSDWRKSEKYMSADDMQSALSDTDWSRLPPYRVAPPPPASSQVPTSSTRPPYREQSAAGSPAPAGRQSELPPPAAPPTRPMQVPQTPATQKTTSAPAIDAGSGAPMPSPQSPSPPSPPPLPISDLPPARPQIAAAYGGRHKSVSQPLIESETAQGRMSPDAAQLNSAFERAGLSRVDEAKLQTRVDTVNDLIGKLRRDGYSDGEIAETIGRYMAAPKSYGFKPSQLPVVLGAGVAANNDDRNALVDLFDRKGN